MTDIGRALGDAIRTARLETGWSQAALARRIGTSQSIVSRLETAVATSIDCAVTSKALDVLGVKVSFDGRTLGLAGRREQRDGVHAACVAFIARRLRSQGWEAAVEVEIGDGRSRGWIDILAYRASDRTLLVIEVKTEIHDVGALLRTAAWYRREAPAAARRLGWTASRVVLGLLALASSDNDERLARQRALIGELFPDDASALETLIEGVINPPPLGAVAMVDPRARKRRWLIRVRCDGRRTQAPYAGYREAASALTRRARPARRA
jgi:transcriptional regulator with XRE-family HTH domain